MNKILKKNLTVGLMVLGLSGLWSCVDLDVPPPNFTTDDEIFTSEEGVLAYMARIYKDVPIIQFWQGERAGADTPDTYVGDFIKSIYNNNGNVGGSTFNKWTGNYSPNERWVWDYGHIRRTNYFLETIDKYEGSFAPEKVRSWKAQALWIRAFRYFEMVKRYGGVPIVDKVLNYPKESLDEIKRPRSREKECYDFILADCDKAIELFGSSTERVEGFANKWDAYALKSRVALFAASIANYGEKYPAGAYYADGITGVKKEHAAGYYQMAYDAAKAIVNGGQYALYKNSWKADDPAAIKKNFEEIFYVTPSANKEAMFSLQYMQLQSTGTHSANCLPYQLNPGYGGSQSVTLDLVERFEYADAALLPDALKSKAGQPFVLNEALTGTDNAPILYQNPLDVFEGIEPRLQGSVTLPGSVIRNEEIEVRYGIMPKGATSYNATDVKHTASFDLRYEEDGQEMTIQGKSGMGFDRSTCTGIYNRKWFDPALLEEYIKDTSHGDVNPWIEFRYAEVLLNIAEVAVELNVLTGETEKMAEAAQIIRDIRERAGAQADKYNAATLTIEAVRSERRKELYFENKTYWDLVRWRVAHEEINGERWEGVKPIYFWTGNGDKHYYMKRDYPAGSESGDKRFTFTQRYYYQDIGQDKANELIIPNPEQTF
ncbi:MAG: RagB/SusD family nutrient uptake outer membrane protein [Bacteroidales bacterium]|nr:RagB/SusD family nutrient uptake outer membrane protein [Bacteroidales bacterium]